MRGEEEAAAAAAMAPPIGFEGQVGSFSESYKITKYIAPKFYEGTVTTPVGTTEVCIQIFPNVELAMRYVHCLQEFTNSHILKASRYVEHKTDKGEALGLAFVERVKNFRQKWWRVKRKDGMWRYKGNSCLGIGTEFQRVGKQIAEGLMVLNKAGYVHSRLDKTGMMLDLAGNVKLCNFDFEAKAVGTDKLRDNLQRFIDFIRELAASDPPRYANLDDRDDEMIWFFKLEDALDKDATTDNFLEEVANYIYRSFLFWDLRTKVLFITQLSQILETNGALIENVGLLDVEFSDWTRTVRFGGHESMAACLYYNATTGTNGVRHLNKPYDTTIGLVRFCYNYIKHPNGEDVEMKESTTVYQGAAAERVFEEFPGLVGCTFYNFFASLRTKHQNQDSGPGEMRKKTFHQYIMTSPSVFDG